MIYTSNIVDIVKVKDGGAGPSLYTWIAYANFIVNAEGRLEYVENSFSTTDSSGRTYIGVAYNKESEYESDDWNDYTWSKIQGEQGEDGQQYFIDINATEVKRFYEGPESVAFSPSEGIQFKFKTSDGSIITDSSFTVEVNLQSFDSTTSKAIALENNGAGTYSFYIAPKAGDSTETILPELLSSNSLFYLISLKKDGTTVFTYIVPIGWALSDDYAKFSVTAAAIQASVDNAGFRFGDDGLTISNRNGRGGIKIERDEYTIVPPDATWQEGVTYYTLENGDYTEAVLADGFVAGATYYTKNTITVFNADTYGNLLLTGEVNATGGKIGEIAIVDGGLYSKDAFSLTSDGLIAEKGSLGNLNLTGNLSIAQSGSISVGDAFFVNGKGDVYAKNITLGSSAKIEKYLQLGENCWIFNPDAYDSSNTTENADSLWFENSFIKVNYEEDKKLKTALDITKDGKIKLGVNEDGSYSSITLDGTTGSIYSGDLSSTYGWKIENGSAVFNNITARGSIKSSVLEYGEVQTIGGMLLVRPSSIIKQVDAKSNTLTLESTRGFIKGDYCQIQLSESVKVIIQITGIEEGNIAVSVIAGTPNDFSIDKTIGCTIIDFGNEKDGCYGIGLNASDDETFMPQRAFSLSQYKYDVENTMISREDKIILGYIPTGFGSIGGQYGLYADNVLVKGKLISGEDEITSGIDSLSSTKSIHGDFSDEIRGNIIFWAGAPNNKIENALFWVDSNGNMYAGSGYFKGAIITESTIQATEIKTAVITGTGEDTYALKIQGNNVSKAIQFYGAEGEQDYFTLTTELLSVNTTDGINIGTTTKISQDSIISKEINTSPNSIIYSLMRSNFIGFTNGSNEYGLDLGTNSFSIGYESDNKFNFYNDRVEANGSFRVKGGFSLWDKIIFNKIIDDNNNVIGFDIDITEQKEGE